MVAVVPTVTPHCRNGSWAGNPHLMESVDETFTAGVGVRKSDNGLSAFIYDRAGDPLDPASYTVEDLSAIPTVVAALGLEDPGNGVDGIVVQDNHFMVGCALDDQGRLWIAGNGLAEAQRVCFSDAVGGVPDLTSWNTLTYANMPWGASGGNLHTYNHFNRLSTGEVIWITDQRESAFEPRGSDRIAYYLPLGRSVGQIQAGGTSGWRPLVNDSGSGTWTGLAGSSRGEIAFSDIVADSPDGPTGDPDDPGPANRVYDCCNFVERRPSGDRLWMVFVFRTAWTSGASSQAVSILYTDEFGVNSLDSWRNIDGDPVPMPLHWNNRDLVMMPQPPRTTGPQTLAIKEDGRPVFVIPNGFAGVGEDPNYGSWIRVERIADSWVLTNLGTTLHGHLQLPHMIAAGLGRELYTITTGSSTVRARTNAGNVGGPSPSIPNGESPVGYAWQKGGPIDMVETISYGTQTATDPDVFSASIDPVALSRGRCDLLIFDGDDPRIFTLGIHRPIAAV